VVSRKWYTGLVTERYKRTPNTKCLICLTPVYRRPMEIKCGRVFCSAKCYGIANRKERPCIVCGTAILASANAKTCSRACANKNRVGVHYRTGSQKDKVNDERTIKLRVFASRGEVCERCGYDKKVILNVHHRDRDHGNNEMSNLELLCPNCHAEEHYLKDSWLSGTLRN